MTSIFERALGADFGRLHPRLRERFGFSSADRVGCVGTGVMDEIWRGPAVAVPFLHLGTMRHILFPECGTGIPFTIENYASQRVEIYRSRFATVASLRELLDLGRALHADESQQGNVAVLAQLLAGAQTDQRLAPPVQAAVRLWIVEIESTLRRLLDGSALADLTDPTGLATAVAAAFIGLELYEGVDPSGATAALDALERLAVLADVVDDLGPLARRAIQSRIRRKRPSRQQNLPGPARRNSTEPS